ncbi:MAG: glycosyltransferase family 2 protein [Bacteroidia bacterium]|nr:glycosyltransferase family 2 protein [Bacteroidia bacterium]
MLEITTIILSFNEEKHIRRCIEHTKKVSKKIYVVDSFSTDRTCEIVKELRADSFEHREVMGLQDEVCEIVLLQNKYVNQAQQFQWALDNCDITTEWTMRIDADEYLSPELEQELEEKLSFLPKNVTGIYLKLGVIFMEHLLKHGYIKPVTILRLWRTGKVYMEQRWMDERCVLKEGKSITLKSCFIDHNLKGLSFFTAKHNNYSNREVMVYFSKELDMDGSDEKNASRNASKGKYYALPSFFRAFLYFFIRYFIFLGFLDGKAGFIWATLQAYWFRFLIDSKLHEIKVRLGENPDPVELKKYIKDYYGITV